MTDQKAPDGLNVVSFRPGRMLHASINNPTLSRPAVKPIVRITGGSLPDTINEAERYLIQYGQHLYQRGDFMVRPAPTVIRIADSKETAGIRLVPIKKGHLGERLTELIEFQRFDKRSKEWHKIDCPKVVAETYLERVGLWQLPPLTAIVNCPTMRPDGSILELGGYDVPTGILYDSCGIVFPPVPAEPTIDDARAALALVKSLVREFPFVDASGLSVALSGILTAMVRRSLPTAPLHAFDAPTVGTGKSKLVDVASMFISGHEAAVITPGKTEEELEKRLGSMLLAGDAVISFDNCSVPLGGDFLCACLTQPIVRARILGKSETPSLLSNAAMFGTGNNFSVFGDMVRRTLRSSLDAKCERPELRSFETEDPVKVLRRNRPPYVVAALTVLRAYVVAGSPQKAKPLGSYEDWSDLVRSSLMWLGETDPCETMEKIRAEDQTLNTLTAVIGEWPFANERRTVKQIIERACEQKDTYAGSLEFVCGSFRDALLAAAGKGGMIDNVALGNWLRNHKDRPIGRKRIVAAGSLHNAICWRLEII